MAASAQYARRARLYAVETATVPVPRLLREALRRAAEIEGEVAEIPCGTGHFLGAYAEAGVPVALLDAEPAMLEQALARAAALGVRDVRAERAVIGAQEDGGPGSAAVVVPNAALNFLAHTVGTERSVQGVARLVRPGGVLLVQHIGARADGTPDTSGCYDAGWPHGRWTTEWTRADGCGGQLTRSRLQHRDGDRIAVRFRHDHEEAGAHAESTSAIEMRVLPGDRLERLLAAAGLRVIASLAGGDRPSETLAIREEGTT